MTMNSPISICVSTYIIFFQKMEPEVKMFRWSIKDDVSACTAIQSHFPITMDEWDAVAAKLSLRQKVAGRAMKERIKLLVQKFRKEENLMGGHRGQKTS